MSNLGKYQWITSTSKKVGGPVNLLLLVGIAGAVIGKLGEIGLKKGIRAIKLHLTSQNDADNSTKRIYSVTANGESSEGVKFVIGDQYIALDQDDDSVLIEKIGDDNNPYFVSAGFLRSISNYLE